MKGRRIKLVDGDEFDALTKARHWFHWRPGQRSRVKRRVRRRERHQAKVKLDSTVDTFFELLILFGMK